MSREKSTHKKRLEEIAMDPAGILGFDGDVSKVVIEEEICNAKGHPIGEIDMWIKTYGGDYYVVEYKATDKTKVRRKARVQLKRAAEYIQKKFNVSPKKAYYVYGNFEVREINLDDD